MAANNYEGWALLEWECALKHPEDGAREGAPFIKKHIIRVTEKAFDEFHLYSLPRPTTLRNRETKQVEFVRPAGVKAKTFYVYQPPRPLAEIDSDVQGAIARVQALFAEVRA